MTDNTSTEVSTLTCKLHGAQASGPIFGGATLCQECIRDFMLGHGVHQLFYGTRRVEVTTEVRDDGAA